MQLVDLHAEITRCVKAFALTTQETKTMKEYSNLSHFSQLFGRGTEIKRAKLNPQKGIKTLQKHLIEKQMSS